jgi:hypothetical protein
MLGQNEEVDALASERAMLGWRGAGRKRKPKEHASLGHDSEDNRHLIWRLKPIKPGHTALARDSDTTIYTCGGATASDTVLTTLTFPEFPPMQRPSRV